MNKSKRLEHKDQTRRKLIKAAFNQFAVDGILSTKTAKIADAAGVAHGTLFIHFPTREDLLITVIYEFGQKVAGRIHELAAIDGSIREMLDAHLNGLIEYESFYKKLVIEGPLLPVEARISLVMIQSAISFHFIKAAELEIASGKIRSIPLHLLFNTWVGLIHYYLVNGDMFSDGGSVLARYREELLDHYISLIRK